MPTRVFQDASGEKWGLPYEGTAPTPQEAQEAIKTGRAQRIGAKSSPGAPQARTEAPTGSGAGVAPWLARTGLGILGGVVGAPVVPPWGSVLGATLGSMGGGTLSRILGWEKTPQGLVPQLKQQGEEALAGAESQMTGMGGGALVSKALKPVSRVGQAMIENIAKREKIPMRAGDITLGRGVQRLENIPTYFPMGAGPTTRFANAQITAADEAAQRFTQGLGPETDLRQAGLGAKQAVRAATQAWKKATDAAYRAVEQAVGDQPIVPTTNIRKALEDVLSRSRVTQQTPPTGAEKLLAKLDPAERTAVNWKVPPTIMKRLGLTPGERPEYLAPHIQQLLKVDKIPYKVAREIAAQFSEQGGGPGAAPVATIRKGASKMLSRAMGQDIDAFMATQPKRVRAMKDAADQGYRIGKDRFNRVLFNAITGKNDQVNPEAVVKHVFSDPETTLAFKTIAKDDLYKKMTVAWMSDIINKSTTPRLGIQGTPASFSPSIFVKQMEPHIRTGHLDTILEPDAAQRVKDLVNVFGRLGRAERLSGVSSGEGFGSHMAMGQLRELLRFGPTAAGLLAGHEIGHPLSGAAFTLAGPYAIGRFTTSPYGISKLTAGLSPTWPRAAVMAAAHLIGQGVEEVQK